MINEFGSLAESNRITEVHSALSSVNGGVEVGSTHSYDSVHRTINVRFMLNDHLMSLRYLLYNHGASPKAKTRRPSKALTQFLKQVSTKRCLSSGANEALTTFFRRKRDEKYICPGAIETWTSYSSASSLRFSASLCIFHQPTIEDSAGVRGVILFMKMIPNPRDSTDLLALLPCLLHSVRSDHHDATEVTNGKVARNNWPVLEQLSSVRGNYQLVLQRALFSVFLFFFVAVALVVFALLWGEGKVTDQSMLRTLPAKSSLRLILGFASEKGNQRHASINGEGLAKRIL